jgi:surface polysaccharide O-acyltransferase-like enzyme
VVKRRTDISIMRITATLAVVLLHTCNTITSNPEMFETTKEQFLYLTSVNALMNWAVPVFLMITGTLLLDSGKKITPHDAVFKYSKRIFLALIVFGIPMSWMEIFATDRTINFSLIVTGVLNVVEGKSWSHLWYLYTLIGIYMILPLLKPYVNNTSTEIKRYILVILFVFKFVFAFIKNLFRIEIAFILPFTGNAIFYLLMGEYLNKTIREGEINKKKNALWLAGTIVTLICINVVAYPNGIELLGYDSPGIAVLSMLIFRQFMFCRWNPRYLWSIDSLTFGVYLVHPVFVNLTYKFLHISPLNFNPIVLSTIFFGGAFAAVSFVASYVMSKFGWLKKNIL